MIYYKQNTVDTDSNYFMAMKVATMPFLVWGLAEKISSVSAEE
jgi:hypothetical protein